MLSHLCPCLYKSFVVYFETYRRSSSSTSVHSSDSDLVSERFSAVSRLISRPLEVIPQHTQDDQVTESPGVRLLPLISVIGARVSALHHEHPPYFSASGRRGTHSRVHRPQCFFAVPIGAAWMILSNQGAFEFAQRKASRLTFFLPNKEALRNGYPHV
jgi:hypothetical protein